MAENSSILELDAPVPFKEIEEANKNLTLSPPQIHNDLVNTFPVKSCGPLQMRLYKGFWFPEQILRGALAMENNFQSRPSDLFLISHPKSGTTWLKAVIFALMTRTKYSLDQHPLLTHNPHQCVPFVEKELAIGRSSLLEAIPSPRILSTHLPYSILPYSITGSDCRIIYICRDPKDVLVSRYHFIHELANKGDSKGDFDNMFEMFCEGISGYGPIWDHDLGYWKESMIKPTKILFLKYEEMLRNTVEHVKRIAKFIGYPFTEDEENQGIVEQIVELCSFKKQKDLGVNKTTKLGVFGKQFSYAAFFRKGLIGDWSNHMTLEMAQKLDGITEEKFEGSGLEIPKVNMTE